MKHFVFFVLAALVTVSTTHAQQAAAPGLASTVAYVDILPASRAQAIDEFRKYREASRQDAGYVAIDIYEQQRRGAYYVVLETWGGTAAAEAHARAAHTRAFLDAMARLGISGYDTRPYGPLSTAPARAVNAQAVYVVSHVDTIPKEGTDPAGLLRSLAEASRREPGNLRFDVWRHAMFGNHFTVVEAWENPAALEAHVAAAQTRQYRVAILPLTGSPLDERLYRAVE